MHDLLPGLHAEIDAVFVAYERERAKRPEDELHPSSKSEELDEDAPVQERGFLDDSDKGGSETFFDGHRAYRRIVVEPRSLMKWRTSSERTG